VEVFFLLAEKIKTKLLIKKKSMEYVAQVLLLAKICIKYYRIAYSYLHILVLLESI